MVGAYQEILGMKHNLFSFTNEAIINFDEDGNYKIIQLLGTQTINDILIDLDYDIDEVHRKLKTLIENTKYEDDEKKELSNSALLAVGTFSKIDSHNRGDLENEIIFRLFLVVMLHAKLHNLQMVL